ncbi:glycoside hydrolase family 45 protein [Dothistroma septosporum NZE10]|uniref:Cellulase n=1 Tax=Dothistroma septosporum (strain NZE10 / CBS 128990) TaxID=675120 RepID=N1PV43_DOTSN|nr:glycoside hydrolase family 45 protein [Dothistroma septosporum NZE10]
MHSLTTALLTALAATVASAASGRTTRYWDCCKPSCAWSGKASVTAPVTTCGKNDQPLSDANAASGCDGGSAYMCSSQSPWAVSDSLAYGFAAVSAPGGSESSTCCACYELTFTSTAIAGKKMIVQATNTGSDVSEGQFDLAMPGGGVGLFNGCTAEWGAPSGGWGAQYGGISSNTCSTFPSALQPGCSFRFDWFEGADDPTVDYQKVTCPRAITAKSGCVRK